MLLEDQFDILKQRIADLQSLIDVSTIISSTLDLDELINLVMHKAQSVMNAEASSIMLLNEDSNLLECRFALGSVQDKVRNKIQLKVGQGVAGWVAEKGEPVIVQDVKNDPRFYRNVDQETGFTTQSIIAAPLKVKGKVIGVAEVINRCDGKPFTKDNLEIFSTFCRQVALAIENAKVHQYKLEQQRLMQQLESAHIIQQSFMPQTFPQSIDNKFQVYGKNIPATSVGGDLFDCLELDSGQLGLIVGDVSGKGIPAALYMARLVSDLRYYSQLKKNAAEAMTAINDVLLERSRRGMFVTLQFLVLEDQTGRLSLVNGGHLPPIHIRSNGNMIEWYHGDAGIPLGILPDITLTENNILLQPGDFIVLYTDGVIEAKNSKGALYSKEKLISILRFDWQSPEELVNYVISDVLKFSEGRPQHDDITVLALKWQ